MVAFETETDLYEGIDVEKNARETLFEIAVEAQNRYAENIQRGRGAEGNHPGGFVDRGEAMNSITISPQHDNATEYRVGGDEVQLLIAEYGRAPNNAMPPHDDISEWARRNGLTPNDGQDWDGMIFGIRKKIAEDGIEGFAPALLTANQMKGKVGELAHEGIQGDLDDASE